MKPAFVMRLGPFTDPHEEQNYHLLINMVDSSLLPLVQGIQDKCCAWQDAEPERENVAASATACQVHKPAIMVCGKLIANFVGGTQNKTSNRVQQWEDLWM
jgi:hypothetical protein